ncbi:hypothetical protein J4G02_05900 [Candidatus Poribacteria bacterium]|nr:hypothetical protein [Candidatus Poribacteria bacterium]
MNGTDRFGHFKEAPRPAKDMDPDAVQFHEKATNAVREILFSDAEKVRRTL